MFIPYHVDIDSVVRYDIRLLYPYFIDRQHPLASKRGKVYVHRHVASMTSKRWLTGKEHVHHIDGDRTNYSPENLEVLTSKEHRACHPSRNRRIPHGCGVCNAPTVNKQFCGYECVHMAQRKVSDRPSHQELLDLVRAHSYSAVGRMYGVSDNAIRKWLRRSNYS